MFISVAQFQLFFLVLTRVLIILVQVPVFGGSMIPNQIKVALGVILSFLMVPWGTMSAGAVEMGLVPYAFAIFTQIVVGALAGFAATLTFGALQVAGKLIEMGSGFSSGQIFNPTFGESGSPLDQFFLMVVMLYFLLINGHHDFLLGMQRTFTLIPVLGQLPEMVPANLLRLTAGLIVSGVQMSLPVMGALLLTDVTLSLLTRVAPQVNVFFMGMPIKVGVGLVALLFSFSIIFPVLDELFHSMGQRVLAILGV